MSTAVVRVPRTTSDRLGALDGLRGVAVLAVTWCHLALHYGLVPRPPGGFIGVVVFFVLSGYLITGIVWRGEGLWAGYRSFVRRRVTRLGPAIAGMCATYVVVMPLAGGRELGDTVRYAAVSLAQGTGLFYLSENSEVPPEFAPTWSLTVEWTFYLLWPLALLALRARRPEALTAARVAVGAAAVLASIGVLLPGRALYILPVANLSVMLLGAALALLELHRTATERPALHVDPGIALLALLAIVTLSILPGYPVGSAYRYAVMPGVTGFTLLVIASIHDPRSIVRRVLATRLLRAIGTRAYSLYLWQVGVFWLVWRLVGSDDRWLAAGVALPTLALVAEASFRMLEKPVLTQR